MSDWLGLSFFVLFIAAIFGGLKILSRPQNKTEAEFERNAAESSTMLGVSMNALQGILDPAEAKAKEIRAQMKEGRYQKKKREGKASGTDLNEEDND